MADVSSNLQKYGVPFYGADWIPYDHIRSNFSSEDKKEDDDKTGSKEDDSSPPPSKDYVAFSGGGGEGRSGIPNAIVVSHVDFASNSLSEQPVVKHVTGSDLPYRMTVHPRGDGIICAMQESCRLFEWEEQEGEEGHKLGIKVSEKVLTQLENVGQQLALKFNSEGSALAVGSEDGNIRVFQWPRMEIILSEDNAHSSIKDLNFSSDGKFLVSLGSGLCRVWDVTSSKVVTSLAKGNDEMFAFCRFSQVNQENQVLYIASVTDKGGSISTWSTTSWKRMRSKQVVREGISAFNVSNDGKFIAVGTVGGDVLILNSASMRVQTMVRKAHLGFVTAATFSHDSRALVSVSLDSSARVTIIKDEKKSGAGMSLWLVIFMIIVAIAAYFMKEKGILLLDKYSTYV